MKAETAFKLAFENKLTLQKQAEEKALKELNPYVLNTIKLAVEQGRMEVRLSVFYKDYNNLEVLGYKLEQVKQIEKKDDWLDFHSNLLSLDYWIRWN